MPNPTDWPTAAVLIVLSICVFGSLSYLIRRPWPYDRKDTPRKEPVPKKAAPIPRVDTSQYELLKHGGKCPVENCLIKAPHSHLEAFILRLKEDAELRKK
jgi:hypothetical protein